MVAQRARLVEHGGAARGGGVADGYLDCVEHARINGLLQPALGSLLLLVRVLGSLHVRRGRLARLLPLSVQLGGARLDMPVSVALAAFVRVHGLLRRLRRLGVELGGARLDAHLLDNCC
eukprot:scaffold96963_cov27-Phaeocystis_antarctica.AAC.1